MALNENLNRYYQLQNEMSKIDEEMKSLKEEIVKEMEVLGVNSQNTRLGEGGIINKQIYSVI